MEYRILEDKTCCFTGHRQLRLPEKEVIKKLRPIIKDAIKNGFNHFICGGALGFDTLAAELIIKLKRRKKITLEIAMPCPEQNAMWTTMQKQKYIDILNKADKQTLICRSYIQSCYQKRNEYMVNNSALVIAFFDGSPSGTMQAVNYAKLKGKRVIVIKPLTMG